MIWTLTRRDPLAWAALRLRLFPRFLAFGAFNDFDTPSIRFECSEPGTNIFQGFTIYDLGVFHLMPFVCFATLLRWPFYNFDNRWDLAEISGFSIDWNKINYYSTLGRAQFLVSCILLRLENTRDACGCKNISVQRT